MSPGLPPDGKLTADQMELIECNLGLAYYLAGRFHPHGKLHIEDRISAATDGLVEAAIHFDPARGVKFATYATRAIARKLVFAAWSDRAIRPPAHLAGGAKPAAMPSIDAGDFDFADHAHAGHVDGVDEKAEALLSTLDADERRHLEDWMDGASCLEAYGAYSAMASAAQHRKIIVRLKHAAARLKITGGRP
jgi:hypothetical protein